MACFLGCFGFSKKRKRPKSGTRILFADQLGHGSYEQLHREPRVTVQTLNTSEKIPIISSDSKFRDEPKEDRLGSKIKKKVSFNLNVRTYEPIPKEEATDYFSDEEPEKATISTKESENKPTGLGSGLFPSNHRYQSFRDSYDEDDDIELEESDMDDEFDDTDNEDEEQEDTHESYDYDDDDYYDNNRQKTSPKENLQPFCSSEDELVKRVDFSKKPESIHYVRDRSQYVHSVLNPVENLTQWKAVKAKATLSVKKQKENNGTEDELVPLDQSKSLIQGFAVDSSLSNWLNMETVSAVPLKKKNQF